MCTTWKTERRERCGGRVCETEGERGSERASGYVITRRVVRLLPKGIRRSFKNKTGTKKKKESSFK